MSVEYELDSWIKNNLNVLFIGKHGVGKTSFIKEAFNRNKLKWKYYSASTMDPWVDFIGVPKESTEMHEGKEITCLKLIRPKEIASGEVEAFFFDEYNRAPKKVRNAVMELIQFKSINGEKFPNLKVIWAAVNPHDDEQNEYDVEPLDPAQEDRFHIKVVMPYEPNADWFRSRFGEIDAKVAIEWWRGLDEEIKKYVSPRRLEYALMLRELGCDMKRALPVQANVTKLISLLKTGSVADKLETFMKNSDTVAAKLFLSNENNFSAALPYIEKSETLRTFFIPLMSNEKISLLLSDNENCSNHIVNNCIDIPVYKTVCKSILDAGQNKKMCQKIRRIFTENPELAKDFASVE